MPDSDELFRQTQKLADLMRELRVVEAGWWNAKRKLQLARKKIRRFLVLECHCRVMPWRKLNAENTRRKEKAAAIAQPKRERALQRNADGDNAASKIIRLALVVPTPPPKGKRNVRGGDAA